MTGAASEKGVEIAAGAVVDEEAGEVRGVESGVESGEEGVVEAGKNASLRSHVGQSSNGGVEVYDFESKVEVVEAVQAAVEHAGEVSGADMADYFEVVEVEEGVGREVGGGAEGGPAGVETAVGEGVERG